MEDRKDTLRSLIYSIVNDSVNDNSDGWLGSHEWTEADKKLDKKLKSMNRELMECNYIIAACMKRGEADHEILASVKELLTDVILYIGED